MLRSPEPRSKTYVVEHLDPDLGPWSTLEYVAIAQECRDAGAIFCLSSVGADVKIPQEIRSIEGLVLEARSAEEIFRDNKNQVCLLDPAAAADLDPDDASSFDVFLFGGILGDDPPRDRTSELRRKGFQGRRLGPVQMTTDTAVRVTRTVIEKHIPLRDIGYLDKPTLHVDEHESTEMPFRYMTNDGETPIMPDGMIGLIKLDSEKNFADLLE